MLTKIALSLSLSLVLASTSAFAEKSVTARQIQNPTQMTNVNIESGRTEVVVASFQDMNVIHTPFEHPKIIKDMDIDFTVDGSSIYFRPEEKSKPFGMFISERDDEKSPKLKLNVIATDLPVGAQINLVLKDDSWELDQIANKAGRPDDYINPMLETFEDIGKYHPKVPPGMKGIDIIDNEPKFYGNTLLILEKRIRTPLFVIDQYTATNRANVVVTLSADDFLAAGSDENMDISEMVNNAVSFYPMKTLKPGESTNVFLMRARQ